MIRQSRQYINAYKKNLRLKYGAKNSEMSCFIISNNLKTRYITVGCIPSITCRRVATKTKRNRSFTVAFTSVLMHNGASSFFFFCKLCTSFYFLIYFCINLKNGALLFFLSKRTFTI